jgi:hypothetical protein
LILDKNFVIVEEFGGKDVGFSSRYYIALMNEAKWQRNNYKADASMDKALRSPMMGK